jgi:hypothetical protein
MMLVGLLLVISTLCGWMVSVRFFNFEGTPFILLMVNKHRSNAI